MRTLVDCQCIDVRIASLGKNIVHYWFEDFFRICNRGWDQA